MKRSEIAAHEAECKVEREAEAKARAEAMETHEDKVAFAKETLQNMKATSGFVALDCPEKGVRVYRLRPQAGATQTGIAEGDLVTKMKATEISTIADIKLVMKECLPGDVIDIHIR